MPKAHVIGLGKSGVAAARLLKQDGWEVEISDSNTSPNLLTQQLELAAEEITVKLGYSLELNDTNLPQLIVVSPGVPWDIPVLIKAREMGIETIGEMELAWRHLQPIPWVGITGTNGKTTTTSLIAAIFQSAGLHAPACGNIGNAASELALSQESGVSTQESGVRSQHSARRSQNEGVRTKEDAEKFSSSQIPPSPQDWIIAELSSYQIEASSSIAPMIGVWTTLTPDHLARHKTVENYYNIKARLLRAAQMQVLNGDDEYLRKVASQEFPDAYWTSVRGKDYLIGDRGFYIEDGWIMETIDPHAAPRKIMEVAALRMLGEHNQQNLLLCVAAARLARIDSEAISRAIREFPGVPHRLEHIITWEGIDFINDSKATNYDAAEVGLASVNSPVVLIAGGEAKAGDDKAWMEKIKEKAVAVVLIGNAAPTFAQRLQEIGYSHYEVVDNMHQAVPRAAQLAKQYLASVVLLSPACASFDQYPNFEARGEDFRQLCQELLGDN